MKKIKEWLEKVEERRGSPKQLMNRADIRTNTFTSRDGTVFDVSIADEQSVKDILTIQRLCYDGKTPWNYAALLHEIRYNNNAYYIMVYQDGQPAAFIGSWLVGGEAHITNIAVVPKFQRMNIATFLIEELKHIAIKEGMKTYSLEVRVSNQKARNLYEKLGFENGKIKKRYYAHDHEDALEMSMNLAAERTNSDVPSFE